MGDGSRTAKAARSRCGASSCAAATGWGTSSRGGRAGGDYDVLPRWTRGGHEIGFRRKNAVYGVEVDVATGQIGMEHKLFDGPYPVDLGYDVAPDGSRFLMVRVEPRPEALPILGITNFFQGLRKKAGA